MQQISNLSGNTTPRCPRGWSTHPSKKAHWAKAGLTPTSTSPYPSYRYHPTKAPAGKIVKNEEEHKALGEGWYATPADFPQTNATVEQSGPADPAHDRTASTTTPHPLA